MNLFLGYVWFDINYKIFLCVSGKEIIVFQSRIIIPIMSKFRYCIQDFLTSIWKILFFVILFYIETKTME